jgi:hypothetical protein
MLNPELGYPILGLTSSRLERFDVLCFSTNACAKRQLLTGQQVPEALDNRYRFKAIHWTTGTSLERTFSSFSSKVSCSRSASPVDNFVAHRLRSLHHHEQPT